ncbi:hypothetical protein CEXT_336801, partial [Caerostris extrusa]
VPASMQKVMYKGLADESEFVKGFLLISERKYENGISDLEINVLRMSHHTQRIFEFGTEEKSSFSSGPNCGPTPTLQMCVHESAVG